MDHAEALDALGAMVAAEEEPVLSATDLAELLAAATRPDRAGNPPANVAARPTWAAGDVLAGTVIRDGARYWRCETPGATASTAPDWPDLATVSGGPTGWLVLDGTVVWADNGTTWAPTWSLDAAAARGWDRKAALIAGRYDFQTGDQAFSRSQQLAQFQLMARTYRARLAGSARITRDA